MEVYHELKTVFIYRRQNHELKTIFSAMEPRIMKIEPLSDSFFTIIIYERSDFVKKKLKETPKIFLIKEEFYYEKL